MLWTASSYQDMRFLTSLMHLQSESGTMLWSSTTPAINSVRKRYLLSNADSDLASVAAAAPQLTHLERLDLHHVQVCPWPPVGA